jgi:hypothetical protein
MVEFILRFEGREVSGSGRDDVGGYTIQGKVAMDGKMAFSKTYEGGSHTAGGFVSAENHGHTVEYRGEAVRRVDGGVPSFSAGVRGRWYIRHDLGNFDGTWHLWPVMMPAMDEGLSSARLSSSDDENECCVCYDRPIDTGLAPCGHVALCEACATRLYNSGARGRRCPLCRADIENLVFISDGMSG